MRKHARLAPSAAHRWMNCTGSVRLIESLPPSEQETESPYAQEGTEAHAVAAMILNDEPGLAALGDIDPAILTYTDAVLAALQPGDTLLVEHPVTLTSEVYGTVDAAIIHQDAIETFDFKFGQGVVVEVRENEQQMIYALAINRNVRRLTIVQPRAPHPDGAVRSWEPTQEELDVFLQQMDTAVERIAADDTTLVPGDHCRFCPAQAHCPALHNHAQLVAQVDFAAVPSDTPPAPETLPVAVAADILSQVSILESWFNALRARIVRELEAGNDVPGWKLVNKRALRVWADPTEVTKWAQESGLPWEDTFEPAKLKSPAQMEKTVGKKYLPDELVARVISGTTLVPSSDARPAVALGAAEEFAALPPAIPDAEIIAVEQGDDEQ